MIIIADSGSTKTHWRVIKGRKISQESTIGLNPYFLEDHQIQKELEESFLSGIKEESGKLFFYGSGLRSDQTRLKMQWILQKQMGNWEVEVYDDLFGAARATCNKEEGIVCILGTGSNSCLFDGEKIVEQVDSLGYILGDEGSGSHLGKLLLSDFLRGNLPTDVNEKLSSW